MDEIHQKQMDYIQNNIQNYKPRIRVDDIQGLTLLRGNKVP